ncbi:MAG: DUF2934 domain-containing protein [Bryobacteraceae bacterium]|nr:DUF2934 domain-containing protein [Bryobacteraceae bacterium]
MNQQDDLEFHEVEKVARELWRERGTTGGSPEDDWFRAEQIVKQRGTTAQARTMSAGNIPASNESYVPGTISTHNVDSAISSAVLVPGMQRKDEQNMDNTLLGTTGQPGTQSSNIITPGSPGHQSSTGKIGETISGLRESVSGAVHRAGEYVQRDPISMPRPEHREGNMARSIEQQTAKIPSDAWLWAAVGSIGLSLALELSGKERTATFVGHWAPTLLILGLYNKIVKLQGSDGL